MAAVEVVSLDVRRNYLPDTWPLWLAFGGIPLWFVLGLGAFIWPLLVLPMVLRLLVSRPVRVPPIFGVWTLFLVWACLSGFQLDRASRLLSFSYRLSLYLSATVILLYVYNLARDRRDAVVGIMGVFFLIIVAGGWLGLLLPRFNFATFGQSVMPRGLLQNSWVFQLVHARFAQVQELIYGQGSVARPSVPFAYTNEWGANLALSLPFAMAVARSKTHRWRWIATIGIAAAIPPLVLSGNRGAWVSVAVIVLYGAFRLAVRGRVGLLTALVAVGLFALPLFADSSLFGLLQQRAAHPGSNKARVSLYQQAGEGAARSPLFGYGAPRNTAAKTSAPAVGTHGQLWTVLFSNGVPGALFFVSFFALVFWRTRHSPTETDLWIHAALLVTMLQWAYYDALPSQLQVSMVAAGLACAALSGRRDMAPREVAAAHGVA
jgi:hypothetical protein